MCARGFKVAIIFSLLSVLMALMVSCANENRQYVVGGREERRHLRRLWSEMETYGLRDPQGLTALKLYAEELIEGGRPQLAHRLLTTRVIRDADNPYNAAILLLLAAHYADTGQDGLAAHYYQQICCQLSRYRLQQ